MDIAISSSRPSLYYTFSSSAIGRSLYFLLLLLLSIRRRVVYDLEGRKQVPIERDNVLPEFLNRAYKVRKEDDQSGWVDWVVREIVVVIWGRILQT